MPDLRWKVWVWLPSPRLTGADEHSDDSNEVPTESAARFDHEDGMDSVCDVFSDSSTGKAMGRIDRRLTSVEVAEHNAGWSSSNENVTEDTECGRDDIRVCKAELDGRDDDCL